ncbi:MAG: ion transporter [Bacteroidales bacterium]|nr:ion transporter [Bacteroidales bacterium]
MKSIFTNDRLILGIIMLNILFIFAVGSEPDGGWVTYVDALFTVFFLVEAIVKIHECGWQQYWQDGWNKFDFIIVLIAIPSLFNLFMKESLLSMNFIFAFRVLRAFKSFLLFHHIPNISKILSGLRVAVKASLLVCVAYIVFLVVFSVLSYALFANDAPEFFGTPLLSMYSIFRLFTIEGWYEMPDAVATSGGSAWGIFSRLYFALLLFAGGIMGMSLVNSIFVDAMVSDNNDEVLEKLDRIEKELQQIKNK